MVSVYQEIVDREQKYLLNTYARYPLAIARGKGVYVYDVEGRRYLDFLTGLGVNALGHAHPRIVKVIRDQAAKIIHVSNLYYNEYQGLLAEKLCNASGMDRAFFSNSEMCIRDRYSVVSVPLPPELVSLYTEPKLELLPLVVP